MIDAILSISPYVEVLVRKLYWKNQVIHQILSKNGDRSSSKPRYSHSVKNGGSVSSLTTFLEECGLKDGDIVVVHSGMSKFKKLGLGARDVISAFRGAIGPKGTLAAPAFPRYEEPRGIERVRREECRMSVYDLKESTPWTGVLPLYLMREEGAIRSLHPLNSMVAVGYRAREMMEGNISGDLPLPCGGQSSWKFCHDNNAWVVALGVDMAHSLTMIHVAEDCYEDEWPVRNWYRRRRFLIRHGRDSFEIAVRERHPKWAMCYAERTLAKDLVVLNIQRNYIYRGVRVGVIASQKLISFLNGRKQSGYPYYLWKNEQ